MTRSLMMRKQSQMKLFMTRINEMIKRERVRVRERDKEVKHKGKTKIDLEIG